MHKRPSQPKKFSIFAGIAICALFTFGGAVNLGWSGFTMAIPLMALWAILSYKAGKMAIFVSIVIFMMIVPFYILKKIGHPVFFPATGKTIILNSNACFDTYAYPDGDFTLVQQLANGKNNKEDCLNNKKSMPAITTSEIVPKGTSFIIKKTAVSHADMGEQYVVYAGYSDKNTLTDIYLEGISFPLFSYKDGTPLSPETLRQTYFYTPSLLMLWPLLPVYLFTALRYPQTEEKP